MKIEMNGWNDKIRLYFWLKELAYMISENFFLFVITKIEKKK